MKYFEYKIISNKVFKKSMMTEEEFNRLGKKAGNLFRSTVTKAVFLKPILNVLSKNAKKHLVGCILS